MDSKLISFDDFCNSKTNSDFKESIINDDNKDTLIFKYVDYLVDKLNQTIGYAEYTAECINKLAGRLDVH